MIFQSKLARDMLGNLMRACRQKWPFEVNALVLLPDHLHSIWTLPSGDARYSTRWGWLKKEFTKAWLSTAGQEGLVSSGGIRDGRRGVWQPKFWEHTLRDETDFENHFDYIHFNPVNHGYVPRPGLWPWSSFHEWVKKGVYPANWAERTDEDLLKRFERIKDTVGE